MLYNILKVKMQHFTMKYKIKSPHILRLNIFFLLYEYVSKERYLIYYK